MEKGQTSVVIQFPQAWGLLHDSDAETIVWKQVFSQIKKLKKKGKALEEEESCLCMTTQPLIPDMILDRYAEIVFEDFNFNALYVSSGVSMAL